MKVVTQPLRENPAVNAGKWYADAMQTLGGMAGSAYYELPYDDDDRTALLYQFFLLAENGKANLKDFCVNMYGVSKYQEVINRLNQELVLKCTREVSYRLNEILEDLGDRQDVPREALLVFHHHDDCINIHGNVQGSNVTGGGSSITNAPATFSNNPGLAEALNALRPLIKGVVENEREAVEKALAVLVQAATADPAVTRDAVKNAATVVAKSSPTLRERLTDIAKNVAYGVAASAISEGIKYAMGAH